MTSKEIFSVIFLNVIPFLTIFSNSFFSTFTPLILTSYKQHPELGLKLYFAKPSSETVILPILVVPGPSTVKSMS